MLRATHQFRGAELKTCEGLSQQAHPTSFADAVDSHAHSRFPSGKPLLCYPSIPLRGWPDSPSESGHAHSQFPSGKPLLCYPSIPLRGIEVLSGALALFSRSHNENGPLENSGPPQSMLRTHLNSTTRVEASRSALESLRKYTPWARALPFPSRPFQ